MSHLDIFYYPVLGAVIQLGFLSYRVDLVVQKPVWIKALKDGPTFDPLGFYYIKIVVYNNKYNYNSIRNVLRDFMETTLFSLTCSRKKSEFNLYIVIQQIHPFH